MCAQFALFMLLHQSTKLLELKFVHCAGEVAKDDPLEEGYDKAIDMAVGREEDFTSGRIDELWTRAGGPQGVGN